MRRQRLSLIRGLRNLSCVRMIAVFLCVLLSVEVPIGQLIAADAALASRSDDVSRRSAPQAPAVPQTGGITANPDVEAALWVAKETVLKLVADNGTHLLDLPDVKNARSVAVDEPRGVLWVFSLQTLAAYQFDGTLLHRVSVPRPSDPGEDADRVPLVVNTSNGSVWLGQHRHLYYFAADGAMLWTVRLQRHIRVLTVAPQQAWVWVATSRGVAAYDETGARRQQLLLPVERVVNDLTLRDAASGELWVALRDTLRRYAPDGSLLFHTALKGIERLASDGQGNVWGATGSSLLLLDQNGRILRSVPGFGGEDRLHVLVADPRDLSVWGASRHTVWHVGTDGRILLTIKLPPSPPIRDLALSVGSNPPLLTFTAPPEGAVLNSRRPELVLRYTDTGQGVDPQTLHIQANGALLAVNCMHNAMQARCTPTTDLPFGAVTFTATIADMAGTVSAPATLHIRVNQAPVANAGMDHMVSVGATVQLSGQASSDPDNDALGFQWVLSQKPSNSQAILQQANTATPSFVADVAGTYRAQLTVRDGHGGSATALVTVSAIVPNLAPLVTSAPGTSATVGVLYEYDVEAVDPNAGDVLTFSLPLAPSGMAISAATGLIQWTPTTTQVGSHDVTVQVQDQGGLFVTQSFTITVSQPNRPPQITSAPVTTATVGQLYSYEVEATDPDVGDVLTFSLATAPTGMTINATTGLIQWTPSSTSALPVTTGLRLWLASDMEATLDGADRVQAWLDQSSHHHDFTQATPTARPVFVRGTGPNGTPLIAFDGVDDVLRNTAKLVTGTRFTIFTVMRVLEPGYPWALGETSNHRMTYEGHPGGGVTSTDFFDLAHEFHNDARATLPGIGDATPKILAITGHGTTASIEVFANGVAATMSTTGGIVPTDFSPGNTLGFAHTSPKPNTRVDFSEFIVYDVDLNPSDRLAVEAYLRDKYFLSTGQKQVTVQVEDGHGGVATQSFSIAVSQPNRPPQIVSTPITTAAAGELYTYDVDATDPDTGNTLTFSLAVAPAGMAIDAATGLIQWAPTAVQIGAHSVIVQVQDVGGLVATQSFTVTVHPCVPAPSGLVSWWPGEGNGQDIVDSNHLTNAGAVTFTAGKVGQAFVFNGAGNSFLTVPNTPNMLPTSQQLTIETWIKPDFRVRNGWDTMLTKRDGCGSGGISYNLGINKGDPNDIFGAIAFAMGVPGGLLRATSGSTTVPNDGQFHHVAATYDGTMMRVYLDGQHVGQAARSGPLLPTSSAAVISHHGGVCGERAVAVMDEIRFYNRPLSATEIQAIVNAGSAGVCRGDGSHPPVIITSPLTTVVVNQLYSYDVEATDPDAGDTLTFALTTAPAGMTINATTGLIQWTPTPGQLGDHTVIVRVQDQDGLFVTQSFTLTVILSNRPPQITSIPVITATAGQLYSYDVEATDPDAGDVLAFSLSTAPTGMTINPTTGLIQWIPTAGQLGPQSVTVRVQDQGSLSVIQTFTVTVVTGPTIVVPDVIGKTPTAAGTALTTATLAVGTITTVDNTIALAFTTLPSAQGWVYAAFGNTTPETQVFALTSGVLQQNTLGLGLSSAPNAVRAHLYQLPGIVDPRLPFTLTLTARVLHDEGDTFDPFSFSVGVVNGPEQFAIGINTQRIRDSFGEDFAITIDTRQWHEYRLEGVPGVGFTLFIDNILVGTGQPLPTGGTGPGFLALGDLSARSNAQAEVQAFAFQQGAGLVIAQTPSAGTVVAKGASVDLTVAQPPPNVLVPDVVGLAQATAMSTLVATQLSVGDIQLVFNPTVPADNVISQAPTAGASVPARTAVALVVSRGPVQVMVPNVVGQTEAEAKNAILMAHLTVGPVATQFSTTVPTGRVISQLPAAGSPVNEGSAVSLVISRGPAPQTTVPNVVGQVQALAESTILAAGLQVGVLSTAKHPTVPSGQVISQQPAAGTLVPQDSPVNLLLSLGPPGPQDVASILVQPDHARILAGDTLAITAIGILGNGASRSLSGQATWASSNPALATIDTNGVATGVAAGTVTISATAAGLTGTTLLTVIQPAPGDTTVPLAALTAPVHHAVVTSPTAILGTATDANFFKYVLEYAPVGTTTFAVLTTGTTPVSNGLLGTLDPTLLLNDLYTLRLTVVDRANNTAETSIQVQVAREQKVGNFTLAFQDLSLPVACLPLTVTRVYDSRDKTQGDFGIGWRLDMQTMRLRVSREQGSAWFQDMTEVPGPFGFPIPTFFLLEDDVHKISLTLPDGHVEEFDLTPTPNQQQFAPIEEVTVAYTARPGTLGALTSLPTRDHTLFLPGATGPVELVTADADIFNPQTFEYTAPDGSVFTIDKFAGVQKVRCTNGPTLTIGPNGLAHSLGTSVVFARDSQGRITAVTDPNGNVHHYTYDANGDLASYTNPAGETTSFLYNHRHGLLEITDPRGVRAIRNEYDAAGRLLSHTDTTGNTITYTRDLVARTETVTNRLGQATTYAYDDKGNVLTQTDALGGVTMFTYDQFGNELTRTDPLGRTTQRTYDSRRNVFSETDALGNETRYTYTVLNAVRTITDALSRRTVNTYDAQGNLVETIDPLAQRTTHTYDTGGVITSGTGNLLSTTNALGHATTYAYDGSGRLTQETNPLGHVTQYTYDANGNRTSQTTTRTTVFGLETLVTTYTYDSLNRLIKTTFPDGSTTQTVYNSIGKQSATIDQLGRQTTYEYDIQGHLIRTTYPDTTSDASTYDAEGRRLTSTDRAGRVTTYQYDALGRLEKITHPDGAMETTTYDPVGQVIATTDARGNTTTYTYDAAGRRETITNALGQVTRFTYDAVGNQQTITDANNHTTTFVYDTLNRRTRVVYPDTTFDQTAYDALGRTTSKTDQAGKTTRFTYDALGRLVTVTDALNQDTTYTYDEAGNQLTQTDANGHTTHFAYNALGRRVKRTLPLGQMETYTYDVVGSLSTKTDFNGKTTTYTYDAVNRLLQKTPDPRLNEPNVQFTYMVTGQRASMSDASGVTTYTYDTRDRLVEKATPQGTLRYTYDAAGNLLSIRSSNTNGVSVDYTYDQLNRLKTVTDNRLTNGVTTYTYDNVGNLQSYLYPNGVKTEYTYNTLNRLTNLTISNVSTLASYTYTLGLAGNRTSVTEHSGRKASYAYDDLYRLTEEKIENDPTGVNGVISYEYDMVGNRKKRASTVAGIPSMMHDYNANDQLTTDTYDDNGNTTDSDNKLYTYDFENHLIEQNGGVVTIIYDGDGNRVAKTVGGVTTRFLVDERNLTGYTQVLEETVNGTVQQVYIYGLNRISQIQASGASFYGYDGHGSVRLLIDTSGVPVATHAYDAFGSVAGTTGTTLSDYLFSGEAFDPALQLYYLRARYYNPSDGRFQTTDLFEGHLADPISLHRYLYAAASPIDRLDPSGQYTITEITAVSAILNVLSAVYVYGRFQSNVQQSAGSTTLGNMLSGVSLSIRLSGGAGGVAVGGGADFAYDFATGKTCVVPAGDIGFSLGQGIVPLSASIGLYMGGDACNNPRSFGDHFSASTTLPLTIASKFAAPLAKNSPFQGLLRRLDSFGSKSRFSVSLGASEDNASIAFACCSGSFDTTLTIVGNPVSTGTAATQVSAFLRNAVGPFVPGSVATATSYILGAISGFPPDVRQFEGAVDSFLNLLLTFF